MFRFRREKTAVLMIPCKLLSVRVNDTRLLSFATLAGIVPPKLLFVSAKVVKDAHPERTVMTEDRSPDRTLPDKLTSVSKESEAIDSGSSPVSWLFSKRRTARFVRSPRESGIEEEKRLMPSFRVTRLFIDPILEGIGPLKSLLFRRSDVNATKFPNDPGSGPENKLLYRFISLSFTKRLNSSGKAPVILFEYSWRT